MKFKKYDIVASHEGRAIGIYDYKHNDINYWVISYSKRLNSFILNPMCYDCDGIRLATSKEKSFFIKKLLNSEYKYLLSKITNGI